jgi:hypothetical protein
MLISQTSHQSSPSRYCLYHALDGGGDSSVFASIQGTSIQGKDQGMSGSGEEDIHREIERVA